MCILIAFYVNRQVIFLTIVHLQYDEDAMLQSPTPWNDK